MSAPMAGRRPSRFTFNIPSPTHNKQPQQQQQLKYAHHPPLPSSFLPLKHDNTSTTTTTTAIARRRKVSTPHPIIVHKKPAAFIDYSLSLQFSPSFSPSSCVISDVSLPNTPTSRTDSPLSDMRQRRWSVEMLRRDGEGDSEEQEEQEDEEHDEEHNIMSPDIQSSSSCSFFSPFGSSSSSHSCSSSSPASPQSPAVCKSSIKFPPAPILSPHRRVQSDPLPLPSTSSVSAFAFKLNLQPLVIPPSKDSESIIMLSALSPLPLCQLTDRQQSCEEYDEQPGDACKAAGAAVDELLYGKPMTLSECWYGRNELMSPVSGASMMYMAAQQNKASQLPFSSFCTGTAAAF